jgi:hypothetical protein
MLQDCPRSHDDTGVMETLLSLGSTLRAVQKFLEGRLDDSLKSISGDFEGIDLRLQKIEAKLDVVSRNVEAIEPKFDEIAQAVGIEKHDVKAGDDEEDRKRIKEKLKEALESNHENSKRNVKKTSFMEYFFGICKKNGRVGKIGSRFGFNLTWHVPFFSEA